jgi:flavin reductase (DIM6/NTAB) family NADH-FMN oxidoreductase RutF
MSRVLAPLLGTLGYITRPFMKKKLRPKPWFFPRPVLLVSTRDRTGKDNIITVSWAGVACSTPPMVTVSIRKSRLSHATICETKEFVVNIPTSKQLNLVDLCGTASGKDVDKFSKLGVGKHPSTVVAAPGILECPINLECQVRHMLPLGSHDLFVAEIVNTHAQHAVLGADGDINDEALDCLAWGSEEFFRVIKWRTQKRVPSFQ